MEKEVLREFGRVPTCVSTSFPVVPVSYGNRVTGRVRRYPGRRDPQVKGRDLSRFVTPDPVEGRSSGRLFGRPV